MKNKSKSFERPQQCPVYRPTLKEFKDPLDYINKIRPTAQKYGICKIVTPKQWNPPFAVDSHSFKFRPRVQRLNEVGAHARMKNIFIRCLEAYCEFQNFKFEQPVIKNINVDVYHLHKVVQGYGGSCKVTMNKQWTQVCRDLGYGDKAKQMCSAMKNYFDKVVQPYLDFCDKMYKEENSDLFPMQSKFSKTGITLETPKMTRSRARNAKVPGSDYCFICSKSCNRTKNSIVCSECEMRYHLECADLPVGSSDIDGKNWVCKRCLQIQCQQELARLNAEVFGFSQSTCRYTLDSFSNYADKFKQTYFKKKNTTLKEVEEEYWRLVAAESDADDVVVKYGADINSSATSSGFPTRNMASKLNEQDRQYAESGWNLNNLPVLNQSVFRFVPHDISGMTVPWCYVGMVFSCFCWHIEDHWSYSINYMHTGDPKTWYGVPESDADKFEEVMRNEAKQLFDKSPDLLHHITTQVNPGILMQNGVQVYRTDQSPGEFVVTFPRAYHAGFNQGFNFAEAVNFCPADWLEKGRACVANYRTVRRPSVFSHSELVCRMTEELGRLDLLLLRALLTELLAIQREERIARKKLCEQQDGNCIRIRTERIHTDNENSKSNVSEARECEYCRTGLYVSGVSCTKCFSEPLMTCLDHWQELCHCHQPDNLVLRYRYSLDELSGLVASVQKHLDQYRMWMTRVFHLTNAEFGSNSVSTEEARVMRNVCAFIRSLDILTADDLDTNIVDEKPSLEELRMLLQLGKSINCPSYLLDFLEDIIETCQKAMSMTDELLKSSEHTVDNSNKSMSQEEDDKENATQALSKAASFIKREKQETKLTAPHTELGEKLSLEEMRLLVEKLHSLPAHVPQLERAASILNFATEWRSRVKSLLLKMEVSIDMLNTVDSIQDLLNELVTMDGDRVIYLPDRTMLQRMLRHVAWLKEAKILLGQTVSSAFANLPTLDSFKKVREQGLDLVNLVEVDRLATESEALEQDDEEEEDGGTDKEKTSNSKGDYRFIGWKAIAEALTSCDKQLARIIADGDAMQKKAEEILNSKPGMFALFALNSLLKSAHSELCCSVPAIARLEIVVKEALLLNEKVTDMWHKLQQCRRLVHIDDLKTLLTKIDSMCVSFEHAPQLRSLARTVDAWRENLTYLFVRSPLSLQDQQPLPTAALLPTPTLLEILFPRPARQFRLMIARENALSTKLAAVCRMKEERETLKGEPQVQQQQFSVACATSLASGRQKRGALASDDPLSVRMDNVVAFENYLKSSLASVDAAALTHSSTTCLSEAVAPSVNSPAGDCSSQTGELDFYNNYRAMCVAELEWMWSLREMNEDKASKDSSGRDFYCICRKRGIDQRGAQVMCDLCQDWLHLACLGISPQLRDLSHRKFLCPQCERSRRPAFELVLAEKRKLEQEARMLIVPEHQALCLMCQRVINFHKHTNQLFSSQTELGAAFAEYKRIFGVHAILPPEDSVVSTAAVVSSTEVAPTSVGKQSRKTPHGNKTGSGGNGEYPSTDALMDVIQHHHQQSHGGNICSNLLTPIAPSKEAQINIAKLRSSLSDEARRELEEIYIELCLLEVSQPSVTWVWKLYHSLIVDDGTEIEETSHDIGVTAPVVAGEPGVTAGFSDEGAGSSSSSDGGVDDELAAVSGDDRDRGYGSSQQGSPPQYLRRHPQRQQYHQYHRQQRASAVDSNSSSFLDDEDDLQQTHMATLAGATQHRTASDRMEYMKNLLASKRKGLEKHRKNYGAGSGGGASGSTSGVGGTSVAREKFAFKRKLASSASSGIAMNTTKKQQQQQLKRRAQRNSGTAEEDEDVILLDKAMRVTAARAARHKLHQHLYRDEDEGDDEVSDEGGSPRSLKVSSDSRQQMGSSNNTKRGRKPTSTAGTGKTHRSNVTPSVKSIRQQHQHQQRKSGTGSSKVCNDDCAATACVQHSSETVNWVACDSCDLWFHWLCVGITSKSQVTKRFLCPTCNTGGTSRRKKVILSSSVDIGNDDIPSIFPDKRTNTDAKKPLQSRKRKSTTSANAANEDEMEDSESEVMKQAIRRKRRVSSPESITVSKQQPQYRTLSSNIKRQQPCAAATGDNSSDDSESQQQRSLQTSSPAILKYDPTRELTSKNSANKICQQNLSPPPPFLQQECYVHEEEVEISYATKSEEESDNST